MANKTNKQMSQMGGSGFQEFPLSRLTAPQTMTQARLDKATNHFKRQYPTLSATHPKQSLAVGLMIFLFVLFFVFYIHFPIQSSLAITSICLILVLNEALCLTCNALKKHDAVQLGDTELPTYTVLLPLFQEAHMVPQMIASMVALNYPSERLEIFFIVEEEDTATINAIRAGLVLSTLQAIADIIIVPNGAPQTKPRACNYALTFANSTFVVIYDAEDRPHPDQLREAAEQFAALPEDKICLQAPLVIKDKRYDWLGSLMAINYTTQFSLQMPANALLGLPIFFGGTSNHIRLRDVLDVGGWDPYNVTEDAELSLRMVRQGFKIGMLEQPTYETATRGIKNHFTQRTRWQKGSFQTFAAHFGSLSQSALNPLQALHVNLTLVNRIMSPLLYLLLLISVVLTQISPLATENYVGQTLILSLATLVFLNIIACLRQNRFGLLLAVPLLPMHWLFLSLTFLYAVDQLLTQPSYWNKTPHNKWHE